METEEQARERVDRSTREEMAKEFLDAADENRPVCHSLWNRELSARLHKEATEAYQQLLRSL